MQKKQKRQQQQQQRQAQLSGRAGKIERVSILFGASGDEAALDDILLLCCCCFIITASASTSFPQTATTTTHIIAVAVAVIVVIAMHNSYVKGNNRWQSKRSKNITSNLLNTSENALIEAASPHAPTPPRLHLHSHFTPLSITFAYFNACN